VTLFKQPPPPPASRIVRDPSLGTHLDLAMVVFVVAIFLAGVLIWFINQGDKRRAAAVHTSAQPVDCPPPSEHEALHIVVRVRDGRISIDDCMYVAGRGAYRRSAAR
jgi:hypothetical protein